jgi:hypothetical protein
VLADEAKGEIKKDRKTLSKNDFTTIVEFEVSGEYKVGDTIGCENLEGVLTVRVE